MQTGTLKSWMRTAERTHNTPLPGTKRADEWTPAERLLALNQTHALDESGLASWCRERGLFQHQLTQWRDQFCLVKPAQSATKGDLQQALCAHKHTIPQLQSNLNRKDKALAEAAALLVLQKRFQALWEDEAV